MPKVKPLISKHWDGLYIPSRNLIALNKDRPILTQIATLAHELIHWLFDKLFDDRSNSYNKLSAIIDRIQDKLWF